MPGPQCHWSRLAILCAVALLAGCTSLGPEQPMASPSDGDSEDIALGVRTLGANGEFELLPSAEIARRLRAALGQDRLSILALSSGGASGAFGAGALVGLSREGARPTFSVVTGVSAGALLAPFAFLGTSWDAEMTSIYTSGATRGLLRSRGVAIIFSSSMYSGEPLRRLIERYANDAMIAAVAGEAAKGRLLLVATTDFASGEPVIWDLGSVALYGGRDAKPLFQTLLLASASIPGMLPPVAVRFRSGGKTRTETHVDGGVTLPFFIAPALEDIPRSMAGARPTVRVIIDGPLREPPRRTRATALAIFSRSLSAGLSHITRTKLESTQDASRQRGISLEYAAIPTSYPLRGAFDFDQNTQRSLFEYAVHCAQIDRFWIHDDERVAERVAGAAGTPCPADDAFIGSLAALAH
jgi:predicted acylesterase/phospholipase RssA